MNSLTNDFIFDEHVILENNIYAKNVHLIPRLFSKPTGEDYYRPFEVLTYSLEYPFWKLNPAGYRLDNVLIHWLNSFLVFLLIGAILKNSPLALLTAVLFCVHPINSYLPAVIAGRAHLLETMFILLAMLAFTHHASTGKKYHCALSLMFFILALFSREGALLLPLFILICAFLLRLNGKKTAFCLIPYSVVAVVYLLLRSIFLPCDKLNVLNALSLQRFGEFIWFMQSYVGQFILPYELRMMIFGNSAFLRLVFFWFYFALTAYFLIRALAVRDKFSAAGALLYITGLLPVINLTDTIKLYGPVLSEQYAYMASIGFFVFISGLIIKLKSSFNKTATALSIALASCYAILTMFNNAHYKDDLTFYQYLRSVSPGHTFTRINLAVSYYKHKMYEKAVVEAQSALSADQGLWEAYLVLGNIAIAKGDLERAIVMFKKVIAMNPRASEGYNNLGCVYKLQGHYDQAIAQFQKAMALNPEYPDAMHNLGLLYGDTGNLDKAMSLWGQALARDPKDKVAQENIERARKMKEGTGE